MNKTALALAATVMSLVAPATAKAQDKYVGEVTWLAGNYCPTGTLLASGQSLPISQYTPLFALLGTMYGGNGQTTFNLPDLRGRVAISAGAGPSLQPYLQGQLGGSEGTLLNSAMLPTSAATVANPVPVAVAKAPAGTDPTTTVNVPATFIGAGAGQAHDNRQPYVTLLACITSNGIYPTRP